MLRAEWFATPRFTEPTPFTVRSDGHVYGHLALWHSCHTGYPDACVQPPHHYTGKGKCGLCGRPEQHPNHSKSGYRYFMLGEVQTDEGLRVDVGQVTFHTGHASTRLTGQKAIEHYDHTGTAACDVRAGEDEYGPWLVGGLRSSISQEALREFRGAKLSGDWRAIDGRLELIGVLSVNVPGFPVPRARVASAPTPHAVALVAGAMPVSTPDDDLQQRMRRLRAETGIGKQQLRRALDRIERRA